MTVAVVAALCVRYLLIVLFLPFSALDKTFGFRNAVKQAQQVFAHPLAVVLILVGLAVEVFCT
ncbi:MAG: DoxX family protein, partial [Caulobacteraceae bacterium]|nr:DoxX family protein [Caulobacter sp.]